MNRSHDQGARDFTPVDRNLLAEGSPTEELAADPSLTTDWADYTALNPMDADVLNRGGKVQQHKPTEGPKKAADTLAPR